MACLVPLHLLPLLSFISRTLPAAENTTVKSVGFASGIEATIHLWPSRNIRAMVAVVTLS